MNDIEQIEKDIKALEEALVEKRNLLEQAKEDGPFVYKSGETYYDESWSKTPSSFRFDHMYTSHVTKANRGLVSKHKSDIDHIIQMELQWGQFRLKAIQIAEGWKPDWSDRQQGKYFVAYDQEISKFVVSVAWFTQHPMTVYFQTREQAQRLANWANKYVKVDN